MITIVDFQLGFKHVGAAFLGRNLPPGMLASKILGTTTVALGEIRRGSVSLHSGTPAR